MQVLNILLCNMDVLACGCLLMLRRDWSSLNIAQIYRWVIWRQMRRQSICCPLWKHFLFQGLFILIQIVSTQYKIFCNSVRQIGSKSKCPAFPSIKWIVSRLQTRQPLVEDKEALERSKQSIHQYSLAHTQLWTGFPLVRFLWQPIKSIWLWRHMATIMLWVSAHYHSSRKPRTRSICYCLLQGFTEEYLLLK